MRVGIIGGGNISDTHARAAQAIEGLTVDAVFGANAARSASLAAKVGATPYDDFGRFLAHGLDLVIIGSPSGCHAEQGIAAARKGLHVLVEKPIDVTTARVDAMLEEVDRAGVKLGVCFQDRLHPDINAAKAFVDAGRLGKPVLASGHVKWYRPPEYYSGSRWRGIAALDGGGAVMNQAIHTVDLLLWIFGPVARVYAQASTRLHSIEVEDTAVAVLEFASGAVGSIEATTSVYPGYPRRVELTGTEGTIVIEHDRIIQSDLRSGGPGRGLDVGGRRQRQRLVTDRVGHSRASAHHPRFRQSHRNRRHAHLRRPRRTPKRRARGGDLRVGEDAAAG